MILGFRVGAFQEEAETVFAEGKALLESRRDLPSLAFLMAAYGGIHQNAGTVREYLRLVSEATRLADQTAALGTAHTRSGDWESAIQACNRSLAIMREQTVAREAEVYTLATLASAHLGRGDVTRAQTLGNEAAVLARCQSHPVFQCAANLVRARAFIARDGARAAGEVEAILSETEQLIAETGTKIRLPEVHLVRAELARLTGDQVSRERHLREARRLYDEMGATGHAKRLAAEMGR
jgi:ATP/maltotriose-dependent transcriptional regulator MalT